MGGMADPYGLVPDEADFLIHPAKFAKGEGIKFYGNYRFIYTDVTEWDYDIVGYNPAGVLNYTMRTNVSGDEYRHDALLGGGFPLGPGRMGFFFTYEGMRGNYDGDYMEGYPAPAWFETLDMQSDLDDFVFSLLYGLPIGSFNLGGEAQIAYRREKNTIFEYSPTTDEAWLNDYYFLHYLYPYDSKYWEALFKGSLEGMVGPLDLEFTPRGGFIFCGDNDWDAEYQDPLGTLMAAFDMDGAVKGWQIGGDLWLRYPVADGLAVPFLVRIDYQAKTRDGDGPGSGILAAGYSYDYEHEQKDFALTVGGGVDKVLDTDSRVAAGIYYNYLQHREDFFFREIPVPSVWFVDEAIFPNFAEHQVLVRLAGDYGLSPAVALRGGLNVFFGWVNWKGELNEYDFTGDWYSTQASGNGFHWGIVGSLGATVHIVPGFTMEPFVTGGYQHLDLDGDGEGIDTGALDELHEEESTRGEWHIGGGVSVLFDVP
jgi:hypothetical protein